ncbi:tyrosine-type recombinase/integrase [Evansella sp. AB-rgal1]|uniref:tyrosine-type recombinase/integrase n=1 Tax=Evansella sp. AB-rgal1 TaxID=3242696 RepID=UPI00359D0DA3
MDLTQNIDQFLDHLSLTKQPSTIKRYRYDCLQFLQWMKQYRKNPSTSITPFPSIEEVSSYYSYLHRGEIYSPNTIRRILSVLRHLFIFTTKQEHVYLISDLIKETKVKKPGKNTPYLHLDDITKLFKTIHSNRGLTEKQKQYRYMMYERNESIFRLILHYGLTIQEISSLTVDRIHFASNEIELFSRKGKKRTLKITPDDRKKLFDYYMRIPPAIRPNRYDSLPFFIAFDYQRGSYRWDEEHNCGKQLSDVALQKMIRMEMRRAGFTNNMNAQKLRKTYIINQFMDGVEKEELRKKLALETTQPLDYLEQVADEIMKNKITIKSMKQ